MIREHPSGFTFWMTAAAFAVGPSQEVVLASPTDDASDLVDSVRSVYAPNAVVLLRTPTTADALAELAPFTAAQTPRDGQPAAYVCQDYACAAPTTDPAEAARLLRAAAEPSAQ